jgi:hypothetical protein
MRYFRCFSEAMDDKYKWQFADTKAARANPLGVINISKKMAGLMCMKAGGFSFPYSWGQRGFPRVCSDEVLAEFGKTPVIAVNYPSYLTRHELQTKRVELLVEDDEDANHLITELQYLIDALPPHDGNPKHQRIVFWFKT